MKLRAPFPWFGGKSRVAHLVWLRFGDVCNYVEPFAGSLAVLLGRRTEPRIETVNDVDCYLANFWRAVVADPAAVAIAADWPVNEADLHARHLWLVNREEFRERMKNDPKFFDAKIAGWWVWGISQWIGGGWCHPTSKRDGSDDKPRRGRPHLTTDDGIQKEAGWHGRFDRSKPRGLHAEKYHVRPDLSGERGIHRKRPRLAAGGRGVSRQIPDLSGDSGAAGRGVHAKMPQAQRGWGRGVASKQLVEPADGLYSWFEALQERLRRVRVCCGDWKRIMGPAVTTSIGVTGVFLDPPYGVEDRSNVYSQDDREVSVAVRDWALENGSNPLLRIALCGYQGEHEMPDTWECLHWKTAGGYGCVAGGRGAVNAGRERIWFSPHCLREPLFANLEENVSA